MKTEIINPSILLSPIKRLLHIIHRLPCMHILKQVSRLTLLNLFLKDWHKLVRDRIPEIIERDGRDYEIATMSEEEYRKALRAKLIEEAEEASEADPENLLIELADVYEIMDAIMAVYGIRREHVLARQEQRRVERGGFEKRIVLLWTD